MSAQISVSSTYPRISSVVYGCRATLTALWACRTGDDEDDDDDLSNNKIVQFCKSLMSFSDAYDGDKFFTVQASCCCVSGECS